MNIPENYRGLFAEENKAFLFLATTMADVLLRRTMCGLSGDLGRAALPRALGVAHKYLGWSEQRIAVEEKLYIREIGELSFAENVE